MEKKQVWGFKIRAKEALPRHSPHGGQNHLRTLPHVLRDLVAHLPEDSTSSRQLKEPTANTSPLLLQATDVTGCSRG
jgi:hypothetical protein